MKSAGYNVGDEKEEDSAENRRAIGLQHLLCNGSDKTEMDSKYILPPSDRPRLSEVLSSQHSIPIVDLTGLHGPQRPSLVEQIKRACEEYGCFQIVNHGVPEKLMENMMEVSKEFFQMPVEDRAGLYSENLEGYVQLRSSSMVGKRKILNWRDILRLTCQYPLDQVINAWPEKPKAFREILANYCTEVKGSILRLLAATSEALGLDPDYLNRCLGTHKQVMTVNYYPKCPNPELTIGVAPHSDPEIVTVLHQDDVGGLQFLKNGKWVTVEPMPNAFVVNVGDQLEVISNGKFKSAEHRVVTNSTKARLSIATFYGPSMNAFIAPAKPLVDEEQGCPALYKGFTCEEYLKSYTSQELKGKRVLNYYKINKE